MYSMTRVRSALMAVRISRFWRFLRRGDGQHSVTGMKAIHNTLQQVDQPKVPDLKIFKTHTHMTDE